MNQDKDFEFVYAVIKNDTEKISGLLPEIKSVDTLSTALYFACKFDEYELIKTLLFLGASPTMADSMNIRPVIAASANCSLEPFRLVMDYYVKESNNEKTLAECIEAAVMADRPYNAFYILENIIKPNHIFKNGESLLGKFCKNKKNKVVDFLIDNGADINVVDKNHNTPLHHASETDDIPLCFNLCNKGANPNLKNKEGLNAYEYAVANQKKNAAKIIKTFLGENLQK